MVKPKVKRKKTKTDTKKPKIESREVEAKSSLPITFLILGVVAIIVVAIVIMALTISPPSPTDGRVVEEQEQPEQEPEDRVIATEAKEILSFMNEQNTYEEWQYSNTESYLIASAGVDNGARRSLCSGVDECKVQWWGTPIKAAKLMVTLSRFHEVSGAEAYFNSMYNAGKKIEDDCIVYNDYTALCRRHNFVFTIDPEYGSNFDGNLMPVLEDLTLTVYREIDYWK